MRRKTLGSNLDAGTQEALLHSPLPGLPQSNKSAFVQGSNSTSTQSHKQTPLKEKWATKTIRLPTSIIREIERMAGERKPDRLYPWKAQDIVYEALEEYFVKQGRRQRAAA